MDFAKENILEDMNIKQPVGTMKITYGDLEISPGCVVTPTQVKDTPTCSWDTEPDKLYTVVMNDLDAPSRSEPKFREWHHWCVTNISGCDISKGQVLSDYVGAGPPKASGQHRYVFLVFRQVGKINFNEMPLSNTSGAGRQSHKAAAFAKKYKFGAPMAGNFFLAEWDEYVPKLYKQLSGK